ncbi:hypothetical protein HJG60_008911 [Phyllostomus discolor]|uniref:Uncharacterized protein n=1 Tax=Phyllostomus discolor TaxID=89673 RepID=A0A834DJB0_9CHIR|nr:hypothetical protein HJG60_008911 [Phyllostomus discolor]
MTSGDGEQQKSQPDSPDPNGLSASSKCASGEKLLAYLEKTSSGVDCSGGTPVGPGVWAEGCHQREVDNEMDDKPTYWRRRGCAAGVLQRELFQLQTESSAEGASVLGAAFKCPRVGGCVHKPAHTCMHVCVHTHTHTHTHTFPKVTCSQM